MAKNDDVTTFVMRGKLQYAKVLGDPVLNYGKDGNEWKFDFAPNDPKGATTELKRVGVADRIRTKDDYLDGKPYMTFKQKELKNNGEKNDPITVVDAAGNPWPQDKLLGNGTVADVKFVVVDFGKAKFKGVYPRSIRVLEHVPFERKVFEELDENDEYYQAAQEAEARRRAMDEQFRRDFGLAEDDEDVGNNGADTRQDDPLDDEIPLD